jgi:hypothetical protein
MPQVYKKLTRKIWLWLPLAVLAGIAIAAVAVLLTIPIRSEALKSRIIALLSDQLESEVTIERLEGRIFPRVGVSGGGVVIRQKGRTDVTPLIQIEAFEIRGSFRDLMRQPRRVAEVRLRGLSVHIPPRGSASRGESDPPEGAAAADDEPKTTPARLDQVIIERFEAPDTVVTLIPRKAGKQPKVFTIHHLVMDQVGVNERIPYIATLTNPVPKGEIETSGTFGPWDLVQPAHTPVTGSYVFQNANLDTINGLAGILSSKGTFNGPLDHIEVEGTTETPNFQLDVGGSAVPLTTTFTALVDGSDGDTYLRRVAAKILDSELVATGAVIGLEGVPGRRVEVNVEMANGRIEDMLRLAVTSEKPLLQGAMRLRAKLVIPPEKKKVIDKLDLEGDFGLSKAAFSDPKVQEKLTGLSRRGQGLPKEEPVGDVLSNLTGRMIIRNAEVSFPRLSFSVPGAEVRLAGRYGLRTEALNFRGELRMQAPLSKVVGGTRGLFISMFDPLFRKDGAGTVVPIRIEGTRKEPKFGLDMF